MIKSFLLIFVLFCFIVILSSETAGHDTSVVKHELVFFEDNEDNEDYGCVHADHSPFDDGDGSNIDMINSILY